MFVFCVWTCVALLVVAVIFRYKQRTLKVMPGFKAVLITGCDHGFGYLLAKQLDRSGYKVFAGCLDVYGEGAKKLRGETSLKLEILQLDVTSEVQIESAKAAVVEMLMGHMLWAVVNNAGIGDHVWFEMYPKVNFRRQMDVNFMGLVNVTRAFLPLVRASKGRIINMSSMAGRTAMPGFSAYSSSKFAVIGFSESLRREMSDFGVRVITVEPSLYNTGISTADTISISNSSFWVSAEPGVKRDYGENYFHETQESWKRQLHFGSDKISQVIDNYIHAVTSAYPCSRYAPPFYMRLLNDIVNMMPCSVQDTIIRSVMRITTTPHMLNRNVNETCKTGRRRSYAN